MPETIKNNENPDSKENLYSGLQNEPTFDEHMKQIKPTKGSAEDLDYQEQNEHAIWSVEQDNTL